MGYMVNYLTIEDDSTTMTRLRPEVDHVVIKRSDSNQFRKNCTGDLLQKHQKHEISCSYIKNTRSLAVKSKTRDILQLHKKKPRSLAVASKTRDSYLQL